MRVSGPTIMWHFSISPPVRAAEHFGGLVPPGLYGNSVVFSVVWSERRGDLATSISECWKPIAPNMWLVMSRRR